MTTTENKPLANFEVDFANLTQALGGEAMATTVLNAMQVDVEGIRAYFSWEPGALTQEQEAAKAAIEAPYEEQIKAIRKAMRDAVKAAGIAETENPFEAVFESSYEKFSGLRKTLGIKSASGKGRPAGTGKSGPVTLVPAQFAE